MCTTRQAEAATVVIETEPQQGPVPTRAKAAVDVAAIMSTFGGGGDMLAASDTTAGPAAEIVTALVTALA
ncbi:MULTISPECIES: hypothetical protein [Mycobacterium]|uniref:hypothetical protein n=1 Tax=Mycobacterium TaxID=1763 RepID=UPI001CDA4A33|nr:MULTISPECIES: hypothetical protein [Mycobacterium]MEE3754888.1 hypothetical protein [Mycobacterium intracellulare]